MNVLFLCETDPDDCSSGGRLRTHLLYEALRRIGRTYVLCGDPNLREVPGERVRMEHRGLGRVRRFVDWVVWVSNSYLLAGCPKWLPFRYDLNVAEAFPGVTFDCVVVRYPHEGAVARPWRYGRLFIDFDDHPLEIYETMSAPRHGCVRRWISRVLFKWVIGRIARRCAGIWVSNPARVGDFPKGTRVMPLENVPAEIPSGYDPSSSRAPYLLAVGLLSWEPNWRGLDAFLTDVWPTVRARRPDLSLRIAGSCLAEPLREKWERLPGVSYLGFVPDLHAQYAQALAAVVPIDGGSGTCIKTREALAHSRVCLSTAFGARGFAADDLADGAAGVLVYRTADEFLSCLERVFDPSDRARLEGRAFEYARTRLAFSNFTAQVERMLRP